MDGRSACSVFGSEKGNAAERWRRKVTGLRGRRILGQRDCRSAAYRTSELIGARFPALLRPLPPVGGSCESIVWNPE
jgi:hypothetical protein